MWNFTKFQHSILTNKKVLFLKKWALVKDLDVNQGVEYVFYCDGCLLALCKYKNFRNLPYGLDIYLDKVQNWLTLISCSPLFLLILPSTFQTFSKFSPHLTVGRTTQRWSVTSSSRWGDLTLQCDGNTLCVFSKFVSRSNNSDIHGSSEFSIRNKIWSTKSC